MFALKDEGAHSAEGSMELIKHSCPFSYRWTCVEHMDVFSKFVSFRLVEIILKGNVLMLFFHVASNCEPP